MNEEGVRNHVRNVTAGMKQDDSCSFYRLLARSTFSGWIEAWDEVIVVLSEMLDE